jgi:hypothetical protein
MPEPYQGQPRSEDLRGPGVLEQRVPGGEIYVYHGPGGCVCNGFLDPRLSDRPMAHLGISSTYTFWRFLIQIPLGDSEMKIHYSINNGNEMHFFVPGRQQTMRLAAYSVRDTLSLFRSILTGDLCSVMDSASMQIQMNFVDLDSIILTTLSGSTC